jgi:hypothetical protein
MSQQRRRIRLFLAAVWLSIPAGVARADEIDRIVFLPDTQKYSESRPEIYEAQTRWIAENAEAMNIRFVSHLGDIVENGGYDTHSPNNQTEWDRARAAMGLLDGVVPYGMTIGNHDFDNWYAPQDGSSQFLAHFGTDRYDRQPWWGGSSPDGLSSYQSVQVAGRDMLFLHLKPDIPAETMQWAQGVLDAHPETPAVISTHIYMKENGRTKFGYMDFYDTTGTWQGHSGDEIFDLLVAPNPQVFLVQCGHVSAERFQVSTNQLGLEVYEMLADYQNRADGGQGFLRILEFDENLGEIRVRTYSPWLDAWETDADSQFAIPMDFTARLDLIPEPATLGLLALAGGTLLRRRR